MALRPGRVVIPGGGRRQLSSWIESFVEFTDNLGSARIFRKWVGIATIAAALEQKVWITTSDPIFANLYIMLVGEAGGGKTRTIMKARQFLSTLKDFHIAPTSMTAASLVDFLNNSKRYYAMHGKGEDLDFNCMTMFNDDWQALLHAYDKEVIAALTIFYDCWPYRRTRTTKGIDIVIPKPQLNLLAGTTPSDLFEFMPVGAWGQGFTSRVILVHSNESFILDDFAIVDRPVDPKMLNDLKVIFEMAGPLRVGSDYAEMMFEWKKGGEQPQPTHPKLRSYLNRRKMMIYKLSMVNAVDRGSLVITTEDFTTALAWLTEAEMNMADIFDEGSQSVDDAAMDEIVEFVKRTNGAGMPRGTVLRKASRVVPIYKVKEVVELLHLMGRLEFKNGRYWAKD